MSGLKDFIAKVFGGKKTDIAIIEQIEKQIGKELHPERYFGEYNNNGYALNIKGQVKELNLESNGITKVDPFVKTKNHKS